MERKDVYMENITKIKIHICFTKNHYKKYYSPNTNKSVV